MTWEEAARALDAPEPDLVLQGHPENVAIWDAWNNRRLEAKAFVRENT